MVILDDSAVSERTVIAGTSPGPQVDLSTLGNGVLRQTVSGGVSTLSVTTVVNQLAKFVVQQPDASVPNAQALSALTTGLVKNTTTTGVLSIAIDGTDYLSPTTGVVSIAGTSPIIVTGAHVATVSLATNGVTAGFFRQSAPLSLVGNPTGALANVTDVSLGAGLGWVGTTIVNTSPLSALSATAPLLLTGSVLSLNTDGTLGVSGGNLRRSAITGDVTVAAGSNVAAFRTFAATSVLGRSAGTTGVPTEIVASVDGQVLVRSGGVLTWGAAPSTSISGTPGGLAYFDGGGALTDDPAHASWDATNLRMGIRVPGAAPAYELHVVDQAGAADRGLAIASYVTSAAGPSARFLKYRGSFAGPTTVTNTDYLGRLGWNAYDGTNSVQVAELIGHVTSGATVATGSVPSEIGIATASAGVTDPYGNNSLMAMRALSTGSIGFGMLANDSFQVSGGGLEIGAFTGTTSLSRTRIAGGSIGMYGATSSTSVSIGRTDGGTGLMSVGFAAGGLNLVGSSTSVLLGNGVGAPYGLTFRALNQNQVEFSAASSLTPTNWGLFRVTLVSLSETIPGDSIPMTGAIPLDSYFFRGATYTFAGGPNTNPYGFNEFTIGAPTLISASSTAVSMATLALLGPPVVTGITGPIYGFDVQGATTDTSIHTAGGLKIDGQASTALRVSTFTAGYVKSSASGFFSVAATIPASDVTGLFYQTVSEVGTSLTQQPILNFDGTVVASNGTGKTNVGLPNVGPGVGLIGGSGISSITLDAQGRVTSAATATYQPAGNYITALTGDVTATGPGSVTATISNNVVTYAKIQTANAHVLIGNPTASAANVSEITLGAGLTFVGTTLVASGSGGTVAVVTGTPPIVITSTPTSTPNVTLLYDAASITLNGGNQIQVAAFTGDVTRAAGGSTTTLVNIPTHVAMAGDIITAQTASPAPPAANHGRIWFDSTAKNYTGMNEGGITAHMMQSHVPVTSQFFTGATDDGSWNTAQPAFTDITGTVTPAQLGSFANGSVLFWNAGLAQDHANFFWDSTNHRLGIGMTTPVYEVDVLGAANSFIGAHVKNSTNGASAQAHFLAENGVGTLAYFGVSAPSFAGFAPFSGGRPFFGGLGADVSIFTQDAHDIIFFTNAVAQARLDSAGGFSLQSLAAGGIVNAAVTSGQLGIASSANIATALGFPAATEVLVSSGTGTAPVGDPLFTYNTSTHALMAGTVVGVNGASIPTNASLSVGVATDADRDHVYFLVGGGTLGAVATQDNTFFTINPQPTTINAGVTAGVYATLRVRPVTYAGPGTGITEATTLYIDGPPNLGGFIATGPVGACALHVAGGPTRLDGGIYAFQLSAGGVVATDTSGLLGLAGVAGLPPVVSSTHAYYIDVAASGIVAQWLMTSSSTSTNTSPTEYPLNLLPRFAELRINLINNPVTSGSLAVTVTRNGSGFGSPINIVFGSTGALPAGLTTQSVTSPLSGDTWGVFIQSNSAVVTGNLRMSATLTFSPYLF